MSHLHDPVQAAQAVDVLGEQVVLDAARVLGLVLRDDRKVVVVEQRASLCWLSLVGVERAPLPDAVPWHEQADCPVDRPPVAGDLGVGVLGLDLVAEEARCLAGGVRDQGLGRRQLQAQLTAQERRYLLLDFLCLAPGACEPQQPVVGLCRPVDYAGIE